DRRAPRDPSRQCVGPPGLPGRGGRADRAARVIGADMTKGRPLVGTAPSGAVLAYAARIREDGAISTGGSPARWPRTFTTERMNSPPPTRTRPVATGCIHSERSDWPKALKTE